LRGWFAKTIGKKNSIDLQKQISLAQIKDQFKDDRQNYSFDLIVKVAKIDKVDEDLSEILLSDKSTKKEYKARIYTRRYLWLRER
jgi:hypothetical protein